MTVRFSNVIVIDIYKCPQSTKLDLQSSCFLVARTGVRFGKASRSTRTSDLRSGVEPFGCPAGWCGCFKVELTKLMSGLCVCFE